jgi:hypothetical protein
LIIFGLLQSNVGRNKEFEETLQALRGKDCDVSAEAAKIRVLTFTLSVTFINYCSSIILEHSTKIYTNLG